ncbi:MAG: sodium:solute symporter family protein [Planctomycetota bacterium]
MQTADYVVLIGYFAILIAIGVWSSLRTKVQEDFFLGGRSFGKLMQTFAAFGAGTGSSDPVNVGRTTFTSGMSGMWSVMSWLFVTPFYWITGVWYRRMRHLTLGDWFVERYESRALGAAYCVFGILFFMVYSSMMFSAIGVVTAPLIGASSFEFHGQEYGIEYLMVPIIGLVVLVYGIMGGLRAAYFTDMIQGMCIIGLSILLIPFGLHELVEQFGDPETDGLMAGFRIMHTQLPESYFTIAGSNLASEFPLHRIVAVVIISLVGIVVQPHFIATGGGSANSELNARVGLVTGNFLKRLCTIGWVLTALIALALFADNPELIQDPQKTWGVASRELLGPGLTGLMLACLLAALMSSADAYMIVGSGLVVRNLYAPYINPHASERLYVAMARITGSLVIIGAVAISLFKMDVFEQLQLTWVFPVLFAAPFWIGMYWRRATTAAAWCSVAFCALVFFLIPFLAPVVAPQLRTNPRFLTTTQIVRTTTTRPAAPSDVRRIRKQILQWDRTKAELSAIQDPVKRAAAMAELGKRPARIETGDIIETQTMRGGVSVFWTEGVKPVTEEGTVRTDATLQPVGEPVKTEDKTIVPLGYGSDVQLKGFGNFRLDFLIYKGLGVELGKVSAATLGTLELFPKIILPFLVMIFFSLITRRNSQQALDCYYAKMKTPVVSDREQDKKNVVSACNDREAMERKKLLPKTDFEFQKPSLLDVLGFILCVGICFAIIGVAAFVASIGSDAMG